MRPVCETCRARKVKCDQRPNGCSNCERLGLRCAASNVSPQEEMGLVATAGKSRPRRGRIYRSCVECRKSKTRCNGIRPACLRCQQRKTQCVYASSALPRWTRRVRAPEMSAPGARPSSPEEPGSLPDADVPSGFSWYYVILSFRSLANIVLG